MTSAHKKKLYEPGHVVISYKDKQTRVGIVIKHKPNLTAPRTFLCYDVYEVLIGLDKLMCRLHEFEGSTVAVRTLVTNRKGTRRSRRQQQTGNTRHYGLLWAWSVF